MTFTGCPDTSLNQETNLVSALADKVRRRLATFESVSIVVWALTPLVVAAVAAVS